MEFAQLLSSVSSLTACTLLALVSLSRFFELVSLLTAIARVLRPVVRQAPNRLVFNTLQALQDIFLQPTVTKGYAYHMSQLRSRFPSIFNALDKDQHRRKRRIIGQAISDRSMRSFEPTMITQIDIFLRQILEKSKADGVVNMSVLSQRLGIDIIMLLAFGFGLNTQTEETYRPMLPIIDELSWRINNYMQFPLIKPIEQLFAKLGFAKAIKFQALVHTMIKTRMAQDADAHHDLYAIVAGHMSKENQDFLRGELWPEATFFIMAGMWGSTATTAITAAFFYLSRNPGCYKQVCNEIRSRFNSADEIVSGPKLASCHYLKACIDETFRMSPSTTGMLWREQAPKKDGDEVPFIVDGHNIPRGTQVGVNLYSFFHNEEYFPDSFDFKPDRWLESDFDTAEQKQARDTMRKAFVPFSLGDRSCAGKAMGMLEMSLTLARTLWFFDFETALGDPGKAGGGQAGRTDGRGRPHEFQLYDMFVASHDGPNLVFRPRGDFCKAL
ncbi:hypothetical protein HIM_05595 [Hirsutella minnesotensis 3608]|uniref:Uncharacterized protein n=1 Tax=Hirsutella minnesotensis 3608 TaxID=1043627 RepID=A0A0F8A5C9_9HYPO|nr:hypothetical protein HIM_05595 [Hirsutella minnesotensis 3608]